MRISGFTMARNADKLYYPIDASIRSMLPLVDEVVVALGKGDEDDRTRELIDAIGSEKVRIIETVWDLNKYPRGMENAHQTDIAKNQCSGDWLLYLQADEVIHEDDIPVIKHACEEHLHNSEVEGFIFKYLHFWGDYNHYHDSHGWYKHEVRIVRNDPEIHSWESAQSFRRIPDFDGLNYRQQDGTQRLKVVALNARIFHYGWVRPPRLMKAKTKALATIHKGEQKVGEMDSAYKFEFDYGPLQRLPLFKGSHPAVMDEWIKRFDWGEQLQYSGSRRPGRELNKHERLKYRIFTFIKNRFLRGSTLGEFRNYILIRK